MPRQGISLFSQTRRGGKRSRQAGSRGVSARLSGCNTASHPPTASPFLSTSPHSLQLSPPLHSSKPIGKPVSERRPFLVGSQGPRQADQQNFPNDTATDFWILKVLVSGGVTYKDEIWHKECFVCRGCKAQLAGFGRKCLDSRPCVPGWLKLKHTRVTCSEIPAGPYRLATLSLVNCPYEKIDSTARVRVRSVLNRTNILSPVEFQDKRQLWIKSGRLC
ncbi:hypothetical protein DPEC_G00379280 [Dallia pectoralis]|nr:hypothetical protein DPEC_G00379280 [Dallia pectoralis]